MRRVVRLVILGIALLLPVAVGCKRKAPERRRATEVRTVYDEVVRTPAPRDVQPELIPLDAAPRNVPAGEERSHVDELLDGATTRQSCNIVMGCPAAEELVALGTAAVAPIIARYQGLARPSWQKYHLLDLLGRIGDGSALPLLRQELGAGHWEARTNAARAIGRLGARTELARLKELLARPEMERDHAFRYALAFAIEKLDGAGGRAVLLEGLESGSISSRNVGYTRVAVEAAAELKLEDVCPLLRPAVEHREIFLKRAAIAAAATLRCPEEDLRRAVAAELESRVPSVRRGAAETLKKLTGRSFTTYEQWLKFEDKDRAAEAPSSS